MCGENACSGPVGRTSTGSPPRVRGKLRERARRPRRARLTPACAGKTQGGSPVSWIWRAHPRVCGENASERARSPVQRGSPPRVRGKRGVVLQDDPGRRLTPACAGKTVATRDTMSRSAAHPRVCGENGSGAGPANRTGWLTPACAGKTADSSTGSTPPTAHPRVCGENGGDPKKTNEADGSPPRVRGKRVPGCGCAFVVGLTPACAGKT